MRIRKVDNNQAQLVKQMRKIPGLTVAHTHTVGKGFPDVLVAYKGVNYLFEIKDPAKAKSARKLTEDEQKFHKGWTGQIAIVETLDDVLKLINQGEM
jgi:hypothetical protein